MRSERTTALFQRVARVGASAERLADGWRGVVLLFAAALAVFAIQSIGWPVGAGRDVGTYLRWYAQAWWSDALFPQAMLARTPVTPIVVGGLLEAGPWAVVVAAACLYSASIVAWTVAAAMTAGPRVALLVAAALLLYPGYGGLFHGVSSDALFAAGFAGWAVLLALAVRRPTAGRFAALGAGVGVLALIRPVNQALLLVGFAALIVPGAWRQRSTWLATFVAATLIPLVGWATANELRFGDFTVARGSGHTVPLFRAFVSDRIMSPDNGTASRELADSVREELLPREPYRSYGIDLDEFFSLGSARMHEDLIGLSDRVWGWDTDYAKLSQAAWEAVREHPGTYARGVGRSLWQELHHPLFVSPGAEAAADDNGSVPASGGGATIVVDGRRLPKPSEGQPIPAARQSGFVSTPDGSAREVWTSPTEHHLEFADPRDYSRYRTIERRIGELGSRFPDGTGNAWFASVLNDASRLYPRPWMWLLVGVGAIAVRRPVQWPLPVVASVAALVVLVFTVLGVYAVPEYSAAVAPAFVVLALTGLFGDRSPSKPASARSTKAGATGSR
jgi:hypothetical protein